MLLVLSIPTTLLRAERTIRWSRVCVSTFVFSHALVITALYVIGNSRAECVNTHIDVANLISPDDTFHAYFDPTSGHSLLNALDDLDALVREADPPYDGVVGFSHGSTLAATLLTRPDQNAQPPFKMAVFLSPGMAANHASLNQDKIEILQPNTVYQRICIPTTLVYAEKDEVAPEQGVLLQGLCEEKVMHVAIHQLGHQIPGIKEKRDLEEAVTAIKLAIEDVSRKSER